MSKEPSSKLSSACFAGPCGQSKGLDSWVALALANTESDGRLQPFLSCVCLRKAHVFRRSCSSCVASAPLLGSAHDGLQIVAVPPCHVLQPFLYDCISSRRCRFMVKPLGHGMWRSVESCRFACSSGEKTSGSVCNFREPKPHGSNRPGGQGQA